MKFDEVLSEDYYEAFRYTDIYDGNKTVVEIWKNPRGKDLLDIFKKTKLTIARGVLLKNGDLYATLGDRIIHDDLLMILSKQRLLEFSKFWYEDDEKLDNFMCVAIYKNKNVTMAESYRADAHKAFKEKYFSIYEKILQKNNKMFKLELE